MLTGAGTFLWRTGDLRTVDGERETLSIGGPAFVGTELASLFTYDLGDPHEPAWKLGMRVAQFSPRGVAEFTDSVRQLSIRTEATW